MKDEKNIEKTIDTANGEGANNTNNMNVEKINRMIEDAKKLTKKYKETSSDVDKENAENAAAAIIETLDKVKIDGYKKVKGSWYAVSEETRESWLTFDGEKTNGEKVSITPEKVEEKFGRCLYVLNVIFAAGMVMYKGQATIGFFEKANTTKTKSQIKEALNLKKEPRPTQAKNPNEVAIKALTTFATAIGVECNLCDLDDAAATIAAAAAAMIKGMADTAKELRRQKAISAAVATMTAQGKVDDKQAAEFAADLYRDDNELTDGEKAFVIAKVAAGKDYQKAVAAAML